MQNHNWADTDCLSDAETEGRVAACVHYFMLVHLLLILNAF